MSITRWVLSLEPDCSRFKGEDDQTKQAAYLDGVQHLVVRVANDSRSPGADVVSVLIPVGVAK